MRRLGFGTTIALLILGQALLYASVLVFVAITIAARGVDYAAALHAVQTDPLPLGASQLAALGAVIALGVWLGAPGQAPAAALGVVPARASVVATAAVAGLALQLPLVELVTLVTRLVPWIALPPEALANIDAVTRISSPLRAFTVPFTFVVIAPVTEELLFRGLILRALRERHGSRAAIVATALLFGAYHVQPQALLYATLVGLLLGVVADRAGSTMPSIALHAGFNALPVILPEAVVRIPGFNVEAMDDVAWPLVLGSSVVAVGALAVLARLLRDPSQTS